MPRETATIGWILLLGPYYYPHLICACLLITSSLPLYDENSYALGVVTKTYLDELFTRDDPTSEATRAEMKAKGPEWCQYCDFAGSLDDAFHLWDAVSP